MGGIQSVSELSSDKQNELKAQILQSIDGVIEAETGKVSEEEQQKWRNAALRALVADLPVETEEIRLSSRITGYSDHMSAFAPAVGRITIFSITGCRHCRAAKTLLAEKGVDYVNVDLDKYPERRPEVLGFVNKKTVPQIFFNEEYVGGAAELAALEAAGELDAKLQNTLATPFPEGELNSGVLALPPERAGRITIFSIVGCRHCRGAKALLKEAGLPYFNIDLDEFPDRRREVMAATGQKTVPQIFIGADFIGGGAELRALQEAGELLPKALAALGSPLPGDLAPHLRLIADGDMTAAEVQANAAAAAAGAAAGGSDSNNGSGGGGYANPFGTPALEAKLLGLVKEMRAEGSGVEVKARRYHFRSYPKCFLGTEAVTWLVENHGLTGEEAVAQGQQLLDFKLIHHVTYSESFADKGFFYRFQEDVETNSLNLSTIYIGQPRAAATVGADLRRQILQLYNDFLSADGKHVDYRGIAASEVFADYVRATAELQAVSLADMDRPNKLAFFINIYNALVIHGTVALGKPHTSLQRNKFFGTVSYTIGGNEYSLNDIENGVLRCNRKPPYALRRLIGDKDPRRQFILSPAEPRIHFALVCGAKSCPPIKLYSPENVEEALTLAAEAFLDDESNFLIDVETHTITISKIMYWYHRDFGSTDPEMLEFLSQWLTPEKRVQLIEATAAPVTIKYFEYDWGANDGSGEDAETKQA